MIKIELDEMANFVGGGSASVDYWCGVATGFGAILCFTPLFPLGVTMTVHGAGCLALNNTTM